MPNRERSSKRRTPVWKVQWLTLATASLIAAGARTLFGGLKPAALPGAAVEAQSVRPAPAYTPKHIYFDKADPKADIEAGLARRSASTSG